MNSYVTPLPYLGVLEINGEDARDFLHGQLTSDISQLVEGQTSWSAWCNAQGRVIATFIITQTAGHYYLILPIDMIETVCRRLKMFVLRSKVKVDDISERYGCLGIKIDQSEFDLHELLNWDFSIVHAAVPNDPTRAIWITARNEMPTLFAGLGAHGIPITDDLQWSLQDIESGMPWIHLQTSEQFLPQELNLEPLGGLSYSKGCYPGQEIIARLHFRGRQKRRLFTGTIGTPLATGTTLLTPAGTQTAGVVLGSTRKSSNNIRLLAIIDTGLASTDVVMLEDGTSLHVTPVPVPTNNH